MRLLGTDFCVLSLRSPAELLAHTCLVIESCSSLCNTWTVAYQAPLSIEFSRQEYWSGLPFSPPGDLPNPGIKTMSFKSPALVGGFFTTSATREALVRKSPSLNSVLIQGSSDENCEI